MAEPFALDIPVTNEDRLVNELLKKDELIAGQSFRIEELKKEIEHLKSNEEKSRLKLLLADRALEGIIKTVVKTLIERVGG
jgi:hypothetical protein